MGLRKRQVNDVRYTKNVEEEIKHICVSTTTHTHLHQLFLLTLSKEKMPTDEKHEKKFKNRIMTERLNARGGGVRKTLSAPDVYFG